MLFRLLLLAIPAEGLYLLLAAQSRIPPAESPLSEWYHPLRFEETVAFFAIWAGLFLVYALAIRVASTAKGRALFGVVLATSALFRATLVARADFSTDAPRTFLQAGSPMEEVFAPLAGKARAATAAALDLASLALLPTLLRALSLPPGLAIVHGWNPLSIKESAGSARMEPVSVLFLLLLAFRFALKRRLTLSALAWGGSLLGPPIFWATLPLAAAALRLHVVVSLVLAGSGWAVLAASHPLSELLGWPPADFVGGSFMPSFAVLARLLVSRDPLVPLATAALVWCAVAGVRLWTFEGAVEKLPREALFLVGWLLFLSPQVLPWSFLPIAALAAFSDNRGWLVFTATAPLAYLALGVAGTSFWLAFAQYFPGYFSLIFIALGRKRK